MVMSRLQQRVEVLAQAHSPIPRRHSSVTLRIITARMLSTLPAPARLPFPTLSLPRLALWLLALPPTLPTLALTLQRSTAPKPGETTPPSMALPGALTPTFRVETRQPPATARLTATALFTVLSAGFR